MATNNLQMKLDNIKLYQELKSYKQTDDGSKNNFVKAKDLVSEYKTALSAVNEELSNVKSEKEIIEAKYNQIPEFIRNFYNK